MALGTVKIRGSIPLGPIFHFQVACSAFRVVNFTSENLQEQRTGLEPETTVSGFQDIRAQNPSEHRPSRKEIKQMWPQAKETLEFLGRYLPKQRLIRAIELLSAARKRRFLRRRQPKYGNMNKGFTEEELIRFLNAVDDPRALLMFTYQAVLGLRIGEAVRLHVRDINLKTKELRIENQKGDRTDYLLIPPQLFEQTVRYISDYEDEIVKREGHLFWAENYPGRNSCPHISKDYARGIFRRIIRRLKMDETYSFSEGQNPKLLHRLTTHSLRHYAITNFSRKNNGNAVLTSRFARHTNLQTTMTYIHSDKDELYRSVISAEKGGIFERVERIQGRI